jgi:hypothetical protein
MNAAELLAKVRARLDDTLEPYLWRDEEIIDDYANPVCRRLFLFCRKMVIDSTTIADLAATPVPLCKLSLVKDTAKYALSPEIIRVVRLKLASQQEPLTLISAAELDSLCPGWQDEPAGKPWGYCLDMDTDCVTFIPAPDADDIARLTVYRLPLEPISLDSEESLGFREEYHNDLIPGILAMAFSKKDSGTDRPDLAVLEEKRFAGRLDDIKEELQRKTATPHTNRVLRAFSSR